MRKTALSILCLLAMSAHADTGFYVGLGMGYSWPGNHDKIDSLTKIAEVDASAEEHEVIVEDKLSSLHKGLFIGYEEDWFAVELDYSSVADTDIKWRFAGMTESEIPQIPGSRKVWEEKSFTGMNTDINRLSLSFLPILALNDRYDLYGRIGYAESRINHRQIRFGPVMTDESKYVMENDRSAGFLAGVGLRVTQDNYSLRLETQYDHSLYGMAAVVGSYVYHF